MQIVGITEVRQDATRLVEAARRGSPVLVVQRSRPAAYLVGAESYERMQEELRHLRHELFWQGVSQAQAEHARGESTTYRADAVEALIADLDLEPADSDSRQAVP